VLTSSPSHFGLTHFWLTMSYVSAYAFLQAMAQPVPLSLYIALYIALYMYNTASVYKITKTKSAGDPLLYIYDI
jgi:hypothetical protein